MKIKSTSVTKRLLSIIIDLFIIWFFGFVIHIVLLLFHISIIKKNEIYSQGEVLISIIFVLYYLFIPIYYHGKTFGKKYLKIKPTNIQSINKDVFFFQRYIFIIFLYNILPNYIYIYYWHIAPFFIIICFIITIFMFIDKYHRFPHDYISKTYICDDN